MVGPGKRDGILEFDRFPKKAHTCKSSAADGRRLGSFDKHLAIKSLKTGENCSGFGSVGDGLVGIMKMA